MAMVVALALLVVPTSSTASAAEPKCSKINRVEVCVEPGAVTPSLIDLEWLITEVMGDNEFAVLYFSASEAPEEDGGFTLGYALARWHRVVIYNVAKTYRNILPGDEVQIQSFANWLGPLIAHELWHVRVLGGHCAQKWDSEFFKSMDRVFDYFNTPAYVRRGHTAYVLGACKREYRGPAT